MVSRASQTHHQPVIYVGDEGPEQGGRRGLVQGIRHRHLHSCEAHRLVGPLLDGGHGPNPEDTLGVQDVADVGDMEDLQQMIARADRNLSVATGPVNFTHTSIF